MEVQGAENVVEFKRKFDNFVHEFISKSQNHCIVSKEKATRILRILEGDPCIDDPQLKYYVKQKEFKLRDFPQLKLSNVLCVPTSNSKKNSSRANQGMFGKYHRVALKDELFSIIYEIHTQEGSNKHLGYKSTVQEINRHHAHIPRALVLDFIKMCPLCSQSPDDLNLLSSGDLSQSSNENSNPCPEDCLVDIKPDLQALNAAISNSRFTNGLHQSQSSTCSSSSLSYVTPVQYSPAPPPSATQWGNSFHRQEKEIIDRADQEIMEANHFMAVGKVNIIDIQELLNLSTAPSQYSYLVHYIDMWSKYSVLWPLTIRDVDELAYGIAKNVFAYFGSPKQIIYDTDFDEAQQLEESLRKWSKQVKVTVGLQEPLATSGPVHWKVIEKLKELLVESWEVKLSELQYISNTKLVTTHGQISPYKAVTGNDPMTETFSELTDKCNVQPESLQPAFGPTEMHNNVPPSETNSNSVDELVSYSQYHDSTPIITNVCHIDLSDSPLIPPPVVPDPEISPTPTECMMDVVYNNTLDRNSLLGTSLLSQRLSHKSGSVTLSEDNRLSTGSHASSVDDYSLDISNNDDGSDNDMVCIDDYDDEEEIDTKNIQLIDDFSSTEQPPPPPVNKNPTTTEPRVVNNGTNIAVLEDFSSSGQPVNSQKFTTQPQVEDRDTKNILLIHSYGSTKEPPNSETSTAVPTEQGVSVLDKLPRLAQSFSFPSTFDNQEEAVTSPSPTYTETSLATSLHDLGQPFLTKSAQNVIDKYKLRAKIQNSALMKATRCVTAEEKPNRSRRKVHQEPLQCSLEISKVSNQPPKHKMFNAIAYELEEKRKEYWRRMKQRARSRMTDEDKEKLNKRRRQKYAERRKTFGEP